MQVYTTIERDLPGACERGEMELQYQPQVDIRSGRLVGVEALMRWNHPVLGLVSPGAFIASAESTGVIVRMGEWAIREACYTARAWQEMGFTGVKMAVNVSPRQLMDPGLCDAVRNALVTSGIRAESLELELTESRCIRQEDLIIATLPVLRDLKLLGVSTALDDFGTGASSLDSLRQLPVEAIKIDRSFVQGLPSNRRNAAIVRHIIDLACRLKIRVTAEGVETKEQAAFLRCLGCVYMQGFLFSRSLPPDRVVQEWLNKKPVAAAHISPGTNRRMNGGNGANGANGGNGTNGTNGTKNRNIRSGAGGANGANGANGAIHKGKADLKERPAGEGKIA